MTHEGWIGIQSNHPESASPTFPLVTVIVLNWNSYSDTVDCLESVLESSIHGFGLEIIVVDNGSSDGSSDRLEKEYPFIRFLRAVENLGFARGNNIGVRRALELGSDYVLLLNDDVIVSDRYILTLVTFMQDSPEVGIAGGKVLFADRPDVIWAAGGKIDWLRGRFQGYGYKQTAAEQKYTSIREVGYIPAAAAIIRARVLESIGLLPECYFLGGEEADFAVQAKRANYKVCYVPAKSARVWHKVGYSSQSDAPMIYNRFRNAFLFLERNLPRPIWWLWQIASWTFVTLFWDVWASVRKGERRKRHRNLYWMAMRDHRKYRSVTAQHLDTIRTLFSDA